MAVVYGIVFILGLAVGSFVNVLIYRIPLKKSFVLPSSACASCGSKLSALELIPILSYLFQRGKCKHCGEKISLRYPLIELLTAVVFVALLHKYGISVPFFAFAFLMIILIVVFFIDIDHKIIPNGLVIVGLAGGILLFVYNCLSPMPEIYGDNKWWTPLAGLLPGSGFLLLVAILGSLLYKTDDAMGMGDVKLMAPIGMFFGWKLCLVALFVSVVLGGVVSLMLMVFRIKKRKDTVAFGPFIVIGALVTILYGWDMANWFMGI